jgi:hypothetical protein
MSKGNDVILLQQTSTAIVGAGEGNDRYILDSALLAPNQKITISDTQGSNSLHLVGGLTITGSKVTNDALLLTLSNGAEVTLLGANTFQFLTGGNPLTGQGAQTSTFSDFVTKDLGYKAVPTTGMDQSTTTVTVNNTGGTSVGGGGGTSGGGGGGGQTFMLTNGADAFKGTAGNDTFVATEATLSSADIIDGGDGTDLFRYASSGQGPFNEAGFEIKNVETVQITSDAVGGTTFDFTGVQGVQTIRNFNSSENLTLTGLKTLASTIEIDSIGAQDRPTSIVNTTIVYDVAATKGTADAVQMNLSGNLNTDGSRVGTVKADGIEIFNVKSSGSASAFDELASNSLREMNITGDADLTLARAVFNNTAAVNTVNAKDFTGNLDITLTNSGAANIDVAVTGGKGNDRADFSNGFNKNDAFDGGDGTDTLALTNGVAVVVNPANFGTVKNVEILEITNGGQNVGANVLDLDNFPGVNTVYYSGLTAIGGNGLVGATTVQDVASGFTVKVNNPNGQNLTTTIKTDGASDVLNLRVEKLAANEVLNTVTAAKFETVNLDVRDDANVVGVGNLTINQLAINNATTLNITGDAKLTIKNDGDPTTPVLTTLNAKDQSGGLTLTGVDFAKAGATITFGSGDDTFNVATANGADTITLGAGKDRVVYTAVAQSNKNMDTITDFVSGTDVVDVRALMGGIGIASSTQFAGNRPNFGETQGALSHATADAVFQQDAQILWVDVNKDGTLDNTDFRVKLSGVTSLTAADLGFTPGVTFTANKVGFNTANAADSVENNAVGPEDDVINATVAQLDDGVTFATVNGLGGADVLNITGTAAPNEIANLQTIMFTNVETVNLAASVEGVKMDAADLGAGQTSKINGASGTLQSLEVNTGTNLSNVAISNIETLNIIDNLNPNTNVTMKVAQHNAFMQINAPGGVDKITLSDSGTLTGDADIETYVLGSAGPNDFTVGAAAQNVTGSAAADTVRIGGLAIGGVYNTFGPADTLVATNGANISGANGGAALGFGTLNLTGTIKMAAAQHVFNDIVAPNNNDKVTFTNGNFNGTADPDVETYELANAAGNDIKLTAAGQNVTGTAGQNDTVETAGLTALNGNIDLGAGGNDVLMVTNNDVNLSGATLTSIETLNVGNSLNVTLTAAQYNMFTAANFVGAGTNTITFVGAAGNVQASSVFENYILNSNGADTITINETVDATLTDATRNNMTIGLAGGGSDTIVIDNKVVNNGQDSSITIANFGADDVIKTFSNGTPTSNGVFYNNYNGAVAIGNVTTGSVIELDATTFTIGTLNNTAAVLAALNGLANPIKAAALNAQATLIVYDGLGQAGIYQIQDNNGANTPFDLIELIAVVNATNNSLVGANFA